MPYTEDPNVTSGKSAISEKVLSFPVGDSSPIYTRLRFVTYDKFAMDNGTEVTSTLISLPMPISIPDISSIRTSATDLGIWGGLDKKAYDDSAEAADKIRNGNTDVTRKGISSLMAGLRGRKGDVINRALASASLMTMPDSLKNTLVTWSGVKSNPNTTMLFEGVNLKSFNLEWRLSPRSLDDSKALKEIIDIIKLRAHPEEMLAGFTLNYPDLCYVEFVGKSSEYLPIFQRAFINNIVASPDSAGGLSFYKSGAPTSISLQLSFTELNIVTRDTLEEQNKND